MDELFAERIFPVLTLPSIPRIPFPTSLACRSTSRCWYAIPRRASASSPGQGADMSPASSCWPKAAMRWKT